MKFRARCDNGESNLRRTALPAVVSRGIEASESFLLALFKAHTSIYLRQLRLKVAEAQR